MKLLQDDFSMFVHKICLNDFTYTDVNFALKILSKFVKFKNKKVYMHDKKSLSWFVLVTGIWFWSIYCTVVKALVIETP